MPGVAGREEAGGMGEAEMSEWVRVSDAVPADGESVLVSYVCGFVVAQYDYDLKYFVDDNGEKVTCEDCIAPADEDDE